MHDKRISISREDSFESKPRKQRQRKKNSERQVAARYHCSVRTCCRCCFSTTVTAQHTVVHHSSISQCFFARGAVRNIRITSDQVVCGSCTAGVLTRKRLDVRSRLCTHLALPKKLSTAQHTHTQNSATLIKTQFKS
jgi:hypothetical protein